MGVFTSAAGSSLTFPTFMQWDTQYLECDLVNPFRGEAEHDCTVTTDPIICPGLPSDFWWSIVNLDTFVSSDFGIYANYVIDETGTSYYAQHYCRENGTYTDALNPSSCSTFPSYREIDSGDTELVIAHDGDAFRSSFSAVIFTDCFFDYPNDNGTVLETRVLDSMFTDFSFLLSLHSKTIYCKNTKKIKLFRLGGI